MPYQFAYKYLKPIDTQIEKNKTIQNEWKRTFIVEVSVDVAKALDDGLNCKINNYETLTAMDGDDKDKHDWYQDLRKELKELARATKNLELA